MKTYYHPKQSYHQINLYMLKKAVCYNIYKHIDYFYSNADYCGMTLSSTILPNNVECRI